jgi:hypothetical protein
MRRVVLLALVTATITSVSLAAQLKTPADWQWRQDAPAPLSPGSKMEAGSWVFVQMPPGWHITTGPGVLLYPAGHGDASGNFSIEADIFLFPGSSAEEYGLFLGGRDIDGSGTPAYLAFVLRADGQAAILRKSGGQTTALADWQPHDAILSRKEKDTAKNVVRVDVDPVNVTMTVNGAKVLTMPRAGLETDGRIGFRVGKDVNLHISTLNVTRRLAPVPAKKEPEGS